MMMLSILKLDLFIVRSLHRPPRTLQKAASMFTRLGDGWLWGLVGIFLLCENAFDAFKCAALAVCMGVCLFGLLKACCGRIRPTGARYSFPSGHTLTAFAMCGSLAPWYPHLSLWMILPLACGIGCSRVILRAHYLSDAVAGAGFGLLLALLSHWIVS